MAKNAVRIISLFKSWDNDGDGLIVLDEFETGLRSLGLDVPHATIAEIYHGWDIDGNGTLTLKELATVLNAATIIKPLSNVDLDESPGAQPIHQQLQQALSLNAVHILTLFNTWDEDGDGLMSKPEFETGLRTLGLDVPSSTINELFSSWDQDGSGTLSMKELATVMNSSSILKPVRQTAGRHSARRLWVVAAFPCRRMLLSCLLSCESIRPRRWIDTAPPPAPHAHPPLQLSHVDLDESPGAPPIPEQLKCALAMNAVKIISLFTSWDEDENGLIDAQEFETGLRALGLDVPAMAIQGLFQQWDSDESGTVSLKELAVTLNSSAIIKPLSHVDLDESPGAPPISEQLKMALATNSVTVIKLFKSWDENRDGLLVRTEFETGLRALGLDVPTKFIHKLFAEWDKDGSGELTLNELTAVLNSTAAINEVRQAAPPHPVLFECALTPNGMCTLPMESTHYLYSLMHNT